MLNLNKTITLDADVINSPNIADLFDEEDLNTISSICLDDYKADIQSRQGWVGRNNAGMDLAMQIQKNKSFPWAGCSNIVFPLVTIAALQFHARAYPAIVNGRSVVSCRVIGEDPNGTNSITATKIGQHMSWQLLEQDDDWEEQQDIALLNLAVVGSVFKKSYYNASKGYNESDLVLAKDLVLNYWAKSVEDCPVKTHEISLFRNEIYSAVKRKVFCDVLDEEWFKADAPIDVSNAQEDSNETDNRAGLTQPQSNSSTPFAGLEQHRWLDLDGDGYEEPYIVTLEKSTGTVLRIVCRFEREEDIERVEGTKEIIQIKATEYFTGYKFIPSADGSVMGIGFGVLLGPLNESVNSAINQLFDSGTIANTAGGFLGRGAKIRGGVYSFSPFQWNRVDSTGDDLRKSIFPLPVREPSAVMFQLLSLIISYTDKISGATDMLTGVNPGQNTPAETSRSMVEQGQKIYSAIFKRVWRGMKWEFRKLYVLNAIYLPEKSAFGGNGQFILRSDYLGSPSAIVPAADPTIASDGQRFARAQMIKAAATGNPAYNQDLVEVGYLQALDVDNIPQLYKGVASLSPPPPDVKVQVEQMKTQVQMAQLQFKKMEYAFNLQEQKRLNDAKIRSLEAQALLLIEQAGGVEKAHDLNVFNSVIEMLQGFNEKLDGTLGPLMQEINNAAAQQDGSQPAGGGVPQLAGPPSDQAGPPVVQGEAGGPQGELG